MKPTSIGILYFFIHFSTEVACFYILASIMGDNYLLWMMAFLYDFLAFVPQFLIGGISDRFPKIPFGLIGTVLLCAGLILFSFNLATLTFVALAVLCLGNACIHISGAELTLRTSVGKMAPSAIFVAGGSFGVIVGKILAGIAAPFWVILILIIAIMPLVVITGRARFQSSYQNKLCAGFKFHNPKLPIILIICLATLVVAIRSYIGYGIPTAWNKTIVETVIFYCALGIGKALGGILIDKIGMKRTIILSTVGALPFLIFGNNILLVSIIGIMLFSMTMAVTLGILVSAMPKYPGIAFGFTTVGLFLGASPVLLFGIIDSVVLNCVIIVVMTMLCLTILLKITKKEVRCLK